MMGTAAVCYTYFTDITDCSTGHDVVRVGVSTRVFAAQWRGPTEWGGGRFTSLQVIFEKQGVESYYLCGVTGCVGGNPIILYLTIDIIPIAHHAEY